MASFTSILKGVASGFFSFSVSTCNMLLLLTLLLVSKLLLSLLLLVIDMLDSFLLTKSRGLGDMSSSSSELQSLCFGCLAFF